MTSKTLLQQANELFRAGNYKQAHVIYEQLAINPLLSKICNFNMSLCTTKDKNIVNQTLPIQAAGSKQNHKVNNINEAKQIIIESGLFDIDWYNQTYADVYRKKADPILHYLKNGAKEGRNPSKNFDTKWYIEQYLREKQGKESDFLANPLLHYILIGKVNNYLTKELISEPYIWWRKINSVNSKKFDISTINQLEKVVPVIIIPVYNAVEEVQDCLEALIKYTLIPYRVIIINDASPDPKIKQLLSKYEKHSQFDIYHNDHNMGFTKTVNRGIELAGDNDVVFLNSDTKVTPLWLRNMMLAAYSEANIGTVTALSNNAGAFSAPKTGTNEIPQWIGLDNYARAISQISARTYPEVPTGNGFCLYIRHDCLSQVGKLDSVAFPRGYGEENDFCMRALHSGWKNIIDDATYVYHVRSASFGDSKIELMKQGREIIDQRYPEYAEAIKVFSQGQKFKDYRARVQAITDISDRANNFVKPRILYVIHTITAGGTPQTNQDLMCALSDRIESFVLICDATEITLMLFKDGVYIELTNHILDAPIKSFPHRSIEYDEIVANWLIEYSIELVHIRHIGRHSLGLVDVVKLLGLKVIFSFHDFYTVCPTVKLIDENNIYCGGKCTLSSGQCKHEMWKEIDFPPLKNNAIKIWKENFATMLEKCDVFITTVADAKQTMINNFPFLAHKVFEVIPHGRDFDRFDHLNGQFDIGEPFKIVFPGNIVPSKGGYVIRDLASLSNKYNIEVHILGRVADKELDAEIRNTPAIIHGVYKRGEFAEKIAAIRPHVGGIFSIWPETWCHTLTELWACGVPVIGFDIGAVGERITKSSSGWLVKKFEVNNVIEVINDIRASRTNYMKSLDYVKSWQQNDAFVHDCLYMSHGYFNLYSHLLLNGVLNEI